MSPLITIEVTPDIARKIRALAEAGVFAIKTGNAQINCLEGEFKSIKTEYFHYPKLSPEPVDTSSIVHVKVEA